MHVHINVENRVAWVVSHCLQVLAYVFTRTTYQISHNHDFDIHAVSSRHRSPHGTSFKARDGTRA